MKTFLADYYKSFGYGAYDEIKLIIVAENESQAHTWAVMAYPKTDVKEWSFDEIETSSAGCKQVVSDNKE